MERCRAIKDFVSRAGSRKELLGSKIVPNLSSDNVTFAHKAPTIPRRNKSSRFYGSANIYTRKHRKDWLRKWFVFKRKLQRRLFRIFPQQGAPLSLNYSRFNRFLLCHVHMQRETTSSNMNGWWQEDAGAMIKHVNYRSLFPFFSHKLLKTSSVPQRRLKIFFSHLHA